MHAIRLHTFGPAENLTYERVEDPEAGPGQVRVAVGAAGVHLLDTALREGATGPAPGPIPLPTIPGREVAGTVVSLGEGADARWLGRRVVAHLGFAPGGYAELAVMDVERLHETPPNLDHAQAVAMIGTGVRRWGSCSSPTSDPVPWSSSRRPRAVSAPSSCSTPGTWVPP